MAPGVVERGEISAGQLLENRRPEQSHAFRPPPTFLFSGCLSDRFVLFSLCVYVCVQDLIGYPKLFI